MKMMWEGNSEYAISEQAEVKYLAGAADIFFNISALWNFGKYTDGKHPISALQQEMPLRESGSDQAREDGGHRAEGVYERHLRKRQAVSGGKE